MSEQNEQLIEQLQRPFPTPTRFGWLRLWRRESATAVGLSVIVVIIGLGLLMAGRFQWPASDPGIPSVEVSAVSLSEAERQELSLPKTSMATTAQARSADVQAKTTSVERRKATRVAESGTKVSDQATGAAAAALADNVAVSDEARQAIRQAQGKLKALAEAITLGDGKTKLKVKPGDGKSAEFFGIKSSGRRFVYVIDRSGSMAAGDGRFLKANKELLMSALRLTSRQQFFVCYFNVGQPLTMGGGFVKASRNGKQKLANWMVSVSPSGGTEPSVSLENAVRMKPDAVFLLTDGGFDGAALQRLRQINPPGKKQVSVNTVAFVSRAGEQQLKQIASENRGDYRFVP